MRRLTPDYLGETQDARARNITFDGLAGSGRIFADKRGNARCGMMQNS